MHPDGGGEKADKCKLTRHGSSPSSSIADEHVSGPGFIADLVNFTPPPTKAVWYMTVEFHKVGF